MSRFQPGERVAGRFDVEGRLAAGGMAEIYAATMRSARGVRRRVALKRILPHLADDTEFVTMFVDEAKLASQLAHPGVVPVLDAVEDDAELLLVLDYVPGWDLSTVLKAARERERRLPLVFAIHVARQLAETLAYCHDAHDADGEPLGIVHRDVTPSNVLLAEDGSIRLLDFGVAKAAARATKTATNTLKGKVAYLAPEQVRGQRLDARVDLYAMGLVTFEMLCRQRAITGRDEFQMLEIARAPDHPSLSSIRADVPAALDGLVARLLAANPDDRPSHAREVADELAAIGAELGGAGPAEVRRVVLELMGSPARPLEQGRSKADRAFAKALGIGQAGERTEARTAKAKWKSEQSSSARSLLGDAAPATAPTALERPDAAGSAVAALGDPDEVPAPDDESVHRPRRANRVAAWAAAAVFVALGGGAAAWGMSRGGDAASPSGPSTEPKEPSAAAVSGAPASEGPAFVRLRTEPPGAEVYVDGEAHDERTPCIVESTAGREHRIRLELEGYEPLVATVSPEANRTVELQRELHRVPGSLKVTSQPKGALVRIDGERRGKTPLTIDDLPRRPVRVKLSLPGHAPVSERVDLTEDPHGQLDRRLRKRQTTGTLQVNSDVQRVRVQVDGREVAHLVPWTGEVPTGTHRVTITDRRGRTRSKTVRVSEGERQPVPLPFGEP